MNHYVQHSHVVLFAGYVALAYIGAPTLLTRICPQRERSNTGFDLLADPDILSEYIISNYPTRVRWIRKKSTVNPSLKIQPIAFRALL